MAALFDTDSEDEFCRLTAEELPECPGDASGDSNISLDEETIESEGESSNPGEEEKEGESVWTRDFKEINIASFEGDKGLTKILPEGANCLDFFLMVFPEELIDKSSQKRIEMHNRSRQRQTKSTTISSR